LCRISLRIERPTQKLNGLDSALRRLRQPVVDLAVVVVEAAD
jgi:hypothetical protein